LKEKCRKEVRSNFGSCVAYKSVKTWSLLMEKSGVQKF